MKLYLSSFRIPDPDAFSRFIGKMPSEIKLALILNSKDYKPAQERALKLTELLGYFSRLGFQVEELNLLDYKDESDLLKRFKQFDILWFNGGNTYCLRWAIAKSGTDKILKNALNSGIIYGGDSAGAIVAGPTLKYYEKADDPSVAPETIYDGLSLIDSSVLPHWGSPEFDEILIETEQELQNEGFKTIRLTNDEYLLVENGQVIKK